MGRAVAGSGPGGEGAAARVWAKAGPPQGPHGPININRNTKCIISCVIHVYIYIYIYVCISHVIYIGVSIYIHIYIYIL